MEFISEKTRGGNLLWLLVLATAVGGFGYSYGYATGHGRAFRQADERLNHMWQFLPASDERGGAADDQAEETSDHPHPGDPGAPDSGTLGVADSHRTSRADS